jgi:hypothetical protein
MVNNVFQKYPHVNVALRLSEVIIAQQWTLTVGHGFHCCARMCSVMRFAYLIEKTRQICRLIWTGPYNVFPSLLSVENT